MSERAPDPTPYPHGDTICVGCHWCQPERFPNTSACASPGSTFTAFPVSAAVFPAEPPELVSDELARQALCSIIYQAERFIQDGLMPTATAIRIRDKAIAALDVDHAETLRILRGDYGR